LVASLASLVVALADGAAPAAGGAAGQHAPGPAGGLAGFLSGPIPLMAMMIVLFYFMLWRPQSKKQKETQDMLKALKKGDEVVTSGGLIGKITGLTDTTVTLEVQEKVRLKVVRSHISGPYSSKPAATGATAPQPAASSEPQK
jgi:preprotein translocase subunit YajC